MTRLFHRAFTMLPLLLSLACLASAQVQTGTPPFSSSAGGPDIIDLANLNIHLDVPIVNKPGRETNFFYDLTYDSSIWYPVSGSWQVVPNWGWASNSAFGSGMTGYITFHYTSKFCAGSPMGQDQLWSNSIYYDAFGTPHPFPGFLHIQTASCGSLNQNTYPSIASDNSGLKINSFSGAYRYEKGCNSRSTSQSHRRFVQCNLHRSQWQSDECQHKRYLHGYFRDDSLDRGRRGS